MNAIASAESIIMAVDKYLHRPDKPVSRRHRDQRTKLCSIAEKYAQIIASGTPRSFKRISPAEQQELEAAIDRHAGRMGVFTRRKQHQKSRQTRSIAHIPTPRLLAGHYDRICEKYIGLSDSISKQATPTLDCQPFFCNKSREKKLRQLHRLTQLFLAETAPTG